MSETELIRMFSSNLKELLKYNNTTQRELSEDTGISETALSRYLSGDRMPPLKHVVSIAYVLDCSLDELIDDINIVV